MSTRSSISTWIFISVGFLSLINCKPRRVDSSSKEIAGEPEKLTLYRDQGDRGETVWVLTCARGFYDEHFGNRFALADRIVGGRSRTELNRLFCTRRIAGGGGGSGRPDQTWGALSACDEVPRELRGLEYRLARDTPELDDDSCRRFIVDFARFLTEYPEIATYLKSPIKARIYIGSELDWDGEYKEVYIPLEFNRQSRRTLADRIGRSVDIDSEEVGVIFSEDFSDNSNFLREFACSRNDGDESHLDYCENRYKLQNGRLMAAAWSPSARCKMFRRLAGNGIRITADFEFVGSLEYPSMHFYLTNSDMEDIRKRLLLAAIYNSDDYFVFLRRLQEGDFLTERLPAGSKRRSGQLVIEINQSTREVKYTFDNIRRDYSPPSLVVDLKENFQVCIRLGGGNSGRGHYTLFDNFVIEALP